MVLTGLVCFQVLLALKFPLGRMAWGGKFTVLPKGFRMASAFSAVLLLLALLNVLEKGDLITIVNNESLVTWVVWLFTGYFAFGIMMNYLSRSIMEKRVMTPVALSLFVTFLIISLTA